MDTLRGTSLYPGIGVAVEEMKEHLALAHEAGINAVFTSLQLPEADPDVLMRDFPLMCEEAHKYGMLVSADIAERTATRFGIDRFNPVRSKRSAWISCVWTVATTPLKWQSFPTTTAAFI